jgi:nitronate monooxygenase
LLNTDLFWSQLPGTLAVPQPQGVASDVSPEHVAMLLEQKPEFVSFHFGLPDQKGVDTIKSTGIFVQSSATTVSEARLLEQRGVDALIAQGIEAGGHRATFAGVEIGMQAGLFSLLPQAHRVALAEANDSCTVVTDLISGRPARYIKNKLIDDLVASGLQPLPIPAQLSLTFPLGAGATGTLRSCCQVSQRR